MVGKWRFGDPEAGQGTELKVGVACILKCSQAWHYAHAILLLPFSMRLLSWFPLLVAVLGARACLLPLMQWLLFLVQAQLMILLLLRR